MCVDLNIDFKEFMRIKHETPDISQFDLLSNFFDSVMVRMTDSSFRVSMEKRKAYVRPSPV